MQNPRWTIGGLPQLNIAMICTAGEVMGPGMRVIIWVQGCLKSCPGCISPDWKPPVPTNLISPADLAERILRTNLADLTISGGEPMLQGAGLAMMIRLLRSKRDISVISFSGYSLEELRTAQPAPGVPEFLAEIDLLIDSPFREDLNDNRGLRGSTNQRLIPLTSRFDGQLEHLATRERTAEIQIIPGGALLVGIPTRGVADTFKQTIQQINSLPNR